MATSDVKSPAAPPPDQMGEFIRRMVDSAPDTMAELTRAFIASRDLNTRVKLRLRMKAILDLVAVDTLYPKVPARDMDHGGGFGRPRVPAFAEAYPAPMGDLRGEMDRRVDENIGGGGVLPVPGADPVPQNEEILG